MKVNLQTISMAIVIILVLSACDRGRDDTTPIVTVIKVEKCSTEKMTSLKKDDKVTALIGDTEIKVVHSEDGSKFTCVIVGDAILN